MPEGPECARIADTLNYYLQNKYLMGGTFYPQVNLDGSDSKKFGTNLIPVMCHLKHGSKVIRIYAQAKRVIFELEINNQRYYIASFLAMTGHWLRYIPKSTIMELKFCDTNPKLTRLNIVTERIYYEDIRKFGFFQIHLTAQSLEKVFKKIGPDLLHTEVTLQQYYQVIRTPKLFQLTIDAFLLEQEYFSGIGNYLKSEILYQCRIAPMRTLGSLTDTDIVNLLTNSSHLIRYAYQCNGLTIGDYIDPNGNKGVYKPLVYSQPQDPEGRPVHTTNSGERTTHWVPGYQV